MFCVSVSLHVCVCLPGPPPAPSTIEFRPEGADDAVNVPSGESCSGAFVAQCAMSQQGHSSSGIME